MLLLYIIYLLVIFMFCNNICGSCLDTISEQTGDKIEKKIPVCKIRFCPARL